jgi:hypothetical protein
MSLSQVERVLPIFSATLVVGFVLGGLFVGFEPIGSDPDQMYRPIKGELARALRQGRVPYWSDRLGLGVPLVAESHVAAFYPPNWVLYRYFDVDVAYRLALWLHHVALVGATYAYARTLGVQRPGAALAGLAFALCGFQAIHAIHEPFYHITPYLCLTLALAERYLATGRAGWLGLLAFAYGTQLTLGHFQLQAWTAVLVVTTGAWRVVADRRPWERSVALMAAIACGGVIAAVQLGPSWELMQVARANQRSPGENPHFFAFPPAHWSELAVPRQFQGLRDGPEDRYWLENATTAREACLYIGTIPLILAFPGWLSRNRALALWKFLIPATFVLATVPAWWPGGHELLLHIPILGSFRGPARQTVLTSLGLCLLAGEGFDRASPRARFWVGLAAAVLFGLLAVKWAADWSARPGLSGRVAEGHLGSVLLWTVVAWSVGVGAVIVWRLGVLSTPGVLFFTGIELGVLYYTGTTVWGRSLDLRHASPVLRKLEDVRASRVAGFLRNLPLHVGVAPARPYLGFRNLPPYPLLDSAQSWELSAWDTSLRKMKRFGITHGAWDAMFDRYMRRDGVWKTSGAVGVMFFRPDQILFQGPDPILDRAVPNPVSRPSVLRQTWTIVRYDGAFPSARVATRALVAVDEKDLGSQIDASDDPREVWFLRSEVPPEDPLPRARSGRVVRWDGTTGEVVHDGSCELVMTRAYYPGWVARVDDNPERPVLRVDGGLQAIHLSGAGTSHFWVRYQPSWVILTRIASILGVMVALGMVLVEGYGAFSRRAR